VSITRLEKKEKQRNPSHHVTLAVFRYGWHLKKTQEEEKMKALYPETSFFFSNTDCCKRMGKG